METNHRFWQLQSPKHSTIPTLPSPTTPTILSRHFLRPPPRPHRHRSIKGRHSLCYHLSPYAEAAEQENANEFVRCHDGAGVAMVQALPGRCFVPWIPQSPVNKAHSNTSPPPQPKLPKNATPTPQSAPLLFMSIFRANVRVVCE